MKLDRFLFICCMALIPALANAEPSWPSKPIRILVTYAPGGGSDTILRALAQELNPMLGTSVLVENRPGAGGTIAIAEVARSAPDGYTLLFATNTNLSISPYYFESLKFSDAQAMAPIGQVAQAAMVLAVRSGLPVHSAQELVSLMKREPRKLNIGTFGLGSLPDLIARQFMRETSTEALEIPYKGTAPMTAALLSGEIDMVFDAQTQLVPYARAGKVRLLAVAAAKRLSSLPDVPTLAEAGVPGATAEFWNAILAPAGTPAEITNRLNALLNKALAQPKVVSLINSLGMVEVGGTPEALAKAIQVEHIKWKSIIEDGPRKPSERSN